MLINSTTVYKIRKALVRDNETKQNQTIQNIKTKSNGKKYICNLQLISQIEG